jgi:hypothetical protein
VKEAYELNKQKTEGNDRWIDVMNEDITFHLESSSFVGNITYYDGQKNIVHLGFDGKH